MNSTKLIIIIITNYSMIMINQVIIFRNNFAIYAIHLMILYLYINNG